MNKQLEKAMHNSIREFQLVSLGKRDLKKRESYDSQSTNEYSPIFKNYVTKRVCIEKCSNYSGVRHYCENSTLRNAIFLQNSTSSSESNEQNGKFKSEGNFRIYEDSEFKFLEDLGPNHYYIERNKSPLSEEFPAESICLKADEVFEPEFLQ